MTAAFMQVNRVGVELWPGAESMGYELTSEHLSITVADLGAHLASVVLRTEDEAGLMINVPYPPDSDGQGFFGCSVGRYANRIANASFELDGERYQLDANEGPNHLHGGSEGFQAYAWSADAETDGATGRVVLKHKSKAGDMGFPGKVQATAIFELTGNRLTVSYRAKVNAPTPVNLTNHTYWNLAGSGTLDGHHLTVHADHYVEVDEAGIPIAGPPAPVDNTRYDCRASRSLAEVVASGGYDRSFVFGDDATTHASLSHDSGRRIDITTNQIGMQVFTAKAANPTQGVALETQALPDTPNRPDFGDCTVRPDDKYFATTAFTFHS